MLTVKRRYEDECRCFREEWGMEFFFVEAGGVLQSNVRSGKYKLFSHVQSIIEKNPDAVVNQEVFCEVLNKLSENYAGRFQDFKKCEKLLLLVNIPFLWK
ncbi:UNVERIFIED_CONTAM: hypothetical protein FKN15_046008 [Acipenser sinensis]